MIRGKQAEVVVARDFFSEELRSVMEKRHVSANQPAVEYLVDLMLRSIDTENYFTKTVDGKLENNVLAMVYSEYLQAAPEAQKQILRRLGDICMMATGFFSDSLKRKAVDVDYYFTMGETAYWKLAEANGGGGIRQPVYEELSVKFKTFSELLNEMSERSGLQSNSDLLRLYEKWLYTGSDRLKGILSEKGIAAPIKLEIKTRH